MLLNSCAVGQPLSLAGLRASLRVHQVNNVRGQIMARRAERAAFLNLQECCSVIVQYSLSGLGALYLAFSCAWSSFWK